ncbi:MAG: hypothetical protein KDB82_17500, partial [Planctomycetes bacterium]|nr:hypothetical protein [Planctomycetota bacterium]
PIAVLLGCVDARVPPEIITDVGAGDLLTVRTIATEGTGAAELIASIAAHRAFLTGNGLLEGVRQKRAGSRLTDLAGAALLNALQHGDRAKALFEAAQGQVQSGARSPRAAVKDLMKQLAL